MLSESIESSRVQEETSARSSWLTNVLKPEWIGQTAASCFWIASVFTYGINEIGDWLQLFAASAWLVANIASVSPSKDD